jgi:tRNA A-37 threonylcarbamoyl transferase component Bud32
MSTWCTQPRLEQRGSLESPSLRGSAPVGNIPERPMFKPPEWEWFSHGEIGWWVRADTDWASVLLGPDGLRLDEWRAEGRLTTIKSGPHRIVYRADLPEGVVYIKHFLVPNRRAKYRQWVRRGKGRNEGKRSHHLSTIGVPTITPIALGEQRKRKFLFENYLVTLDITETTPLDEFVEKTLPTWPEPERARVRMKLAQSLGVMTARLHDAALFHDDFHPGNLLVRFRVPGEPELVMIDLDALRKRKKVTHKLAWQNLALLDHFFWLRSSRTDRFRFLKTYVSARAEGPTDIAGFARRIEDATREWAERLWTRWGKRCRSSNKYFETYEAPLAKGIAARDLDPDEFRAILNDPDGPFGQASTTILKDSRTTTVAELTLRVNGNPTSVIYKRFNRKKWLDPLLSLFRPSRAWRSWQAGQDLAARGIPTPRNLAYLARMRAWRTSFFTGFLPHETYLITVKEEGVVDLSTYVRDHLPKLPLEVRRARIRRLTVSLAQLLRSLHQRSLSHRDLKASNILIKVDAASEADELSLIDLVGVRRLHPLPWRRKAQNLARLSLSLDAVPGRTRTDALRFLRVYLPWGLSPLNDWKSLWRSIGRAMNLKRDRNLRSGRPLS